MTKWPLVSLESVSDLSGGYAFKSREYALSGRFVLRTLNIGDDGRVNTEQAVYIPLEDCPKYSRFDLKVNDVLFVMVGATLGKIGVVREHDLPALLNQNMWRIRALGKKIDQRYLYYAFKYHSASGLAGASGSARQFVRRDDYRRLAIPLPPSRIQSQIGELLGTLDDKIDLNQRMNETLEATARAIFEDWFVDFGPTRAKMEGRTPYLSPEVWSVFPEQIGRTGLPDEWLPTTLAAHATLNPESWGRSDYPDEIEYVDLSGVKWGSIYNSQNIERCDAPSRAQRIVRRGDTIVGTVRPGNGSFALVDRKGLTASTGFAVLRPMQRTSREFVYLAATRPENIDRLAHLADGAAYPAINPEVVLGTEVANGDQRHIEAFSNVVRPLIDRLGSNESESKTLGAIRDLLLPKLMSGELRARDAERMAGAVL